ncbi:DnaJ domain-containing protein [Halopseudomonas xinjiangensis]|uniref:DnaJ domain-containing protein n=1 Tax=Halopseudomonas xinjiangensis TaxID=487184 RepID=A0A1H1SJ22_9GAMM|nr:DNA-J related domain-containing protein [Halopseudomonas xinjiangensis]SDS47931.1 DnaJ domain-containing protein [Halopseudomonas xinjiangensis]
MTTSLPDHLLPPGFDQLLLDVLESTPHGMDEFTLIKQLAAEHPDSVFASPGALRDPLRLFQLHFLLFHSLYRLSDRLAASGRQLHIHALRIVIEPREPGAPGLALNDPLRSYYLDWTQWATTHADDVQALLDSFWRGGGIDDHEVTAALDCFGLKNPTDSGEIKRRYRQLVSQHHPDRGGDTEQLQAINAAMLILERYYRPR